MKRRYKISLTLLGVVLMSAFALTSCSALGELPSGQRLERIEKSPHYKDGAFHNVEETPMFTGESSTFENYFNFLFNDWERLKPEVPLTGEPLDLKALESNEDYFVWLGHSSLFMQLDGIKILVDPVLKDYAAPVFFLNKSFKEKVTFSIEDFINLGVDVVLLSHDHYDHLEMDTIKDLQDKVKVMICPLGVGSHLEYWGVDPQKIIERNWDENYTYESLTFNFVTARHFSGRFLTRDKSLWTGFVLSREGKAPIYISGDSGYGKHFKEIGEKFPQISLAFVECGQYNENWALIHMTPEESATSVSDVRAKFGIPLHSGRFALSNHTWDDPYIRFNAKALTLDYTPLFPLMGQVVFLSSLENQDATQKLKTQTWWVDDAKAEAQYLKEQEN